ncbi:hypothetical protein [Sphingomonas quercus]|uniref:WYL domain-containing protein n=1 Tax=Sphingomonas quercus TaxID=2842451 RepID=A0ABS6BNN0_9SPHN|nr:hypothetical protein [Sphingomonas quercus]MBU3078996.1 hypothetical protein [Sphingomonas quercus]
MFFRGSRYETIAEAEIAGPDGRTIRYKRMRFVPQTQGRPGEKVLDGDRPDLVAYRALGDPEQYWRLCDVNRVIAPADLTAPPGRRLLSPARNG